MGLGHGRGWAGESVHREASGRRPGQAARQMPMAAGEPQRQRDMTGGVLGTEHEPGFPVGGEGSPCEARSEEPPEQPRPQLPDSPALTFP